MPVVLISHQTLERFGSLTFSDVVQKKEMRPNTGNDEQQLNAPTTGNQSVDRRWRCRHEAESS